MTFNEYTNKALETAVYPGQGTTTGLLYTILGMYGEAGEFAEKVKKVIRDNDGVLDHLKYQDMILELGDMMWYMVSVLEELYALYASSIGEGEAWLVKQSLAEVAQTNVDKLESRRERNVIHGDGDHR